jgi:hypothetical protein
MQAVAGPPPVQDIVQDGARARVALRQYAAYAAKVLVEEKGVSLLQGHTHRFGVHARTTVDGRVLLGIENFSMCSRSQSYVSHANWQLGFSLVYFRPESERFHWFPILFCSDYRFVWRNREYTLEGVRSAR